MTDRMPDAAKECYTERELRIAVHEKLCMCGGQSNKDAVRYQPFSLEEAVKKSHLRPEEKSKWLGMLRLISEYREINDATENRKLTKDQKSRMMEKIYLDIIDADILLDAEEYLKKWIRQSGCHFSQQLIYCYPDTEYEFDEIFNFDFLDNKGNITVERVNAEFLPFLEKTISEMEEKNRKRAESSIWLRIKSAVLVDQKTLHLQK